jgi:hypothetical protein
MECLGCDFKACCQPRRPLTAADVVKAGSYGICCYRAFFQSCGCGGDVWVFGVVARRATSRWLLKLLCGLKHIHSATASYLWVVCVLLALRRKKGDKEMVAGIEV